MYIVAKLLQPLKQSLPKLVTDDGMVTEVNFLQERKHPFPTLFTDDGIWIEAKSKQ